MSEIVFSSINKAKIKKNELGFFKDFLKISRDSFFLCDLCPAKLAKIKFLEYIVLPNRGLFAPRGAAICTTQVGRAFNKAPQTVMNWITELIETGFLICCNDKYMTGKFSKRYKVKLSEKNIAFFNSKNGYENPELNKKIIAKRKLRLERWAKFDYLTYEIADILPIAQCYLGCQKSFINDILNRIPLRVLQSPRENSFKEIKMFDFYYAFRLVTKNANWNLAPANKPYAASKSFKKFVCSSGIKFEWLYNDYMFCDEKIKTYVDNINSCQRLIRSAIYTAKNKRDRNNFNKLKRVAKHYNLAKTYDGNHRRFKIHEKITNQKTGKTYLSVFPSVYSLKTYERT